MAGPRDDPLRLAVELARSVVVGIDTVDLERPTPCESWNVCEVLNAMVVKANLFAAAVHEPRAAKPSPWPNRLGDDPSTAVTDALEALVTAYERPVPGLVVLPLGEVPWAVARQVATLDVTLHTWDLTVATGQRVDFHPDLVDACLAAATMITDELRDKGEFKPASHARAGATPLEALVAAAGRSPAWTRPTGA